MPRRLLSGESIEKDRQIHKLMLQADGRNIGEPQLIYSAQLHTARHVYVNFNSWFESVVLTNADRLSDNRLSRGMSRATRL
jgi:hypothetical protein